MRKMFILIIFCATACQIGPKPIDYGKTGCHYCSMTIVDKQHAAQLVTDKGKIYNFDATECVLSFIEDFDQEAIAMVMVNDYSNPGSLVNVTEATFIISEGIPSPMGAFITAFGIEKKAEEAVASHGGRILRWESLKQEFQSNHHPSN